MPGVAHIARCDQCRQAKKKCDGLKPECGRCRRLGLQCGGPHVQRYKFVAEQFRFKNRGAMVVHNNPSSESEATAQSLMKLLEVTEIGYDLDPHKIFFHHLPQRLESSPALRASVNAVEKSWQFMRYGQCRSEALQLYGMAMKAVRVALKDPSQAYTVSTVLAIHTLMVSQEFLIYPEIPSTAHLKMMFHLLRHAVKHGWIQEFEHILLMAVTWGIIWESMVQPYIKLEPWFHDLVKAPSQGPHKRTYTTYTAYHTSMAQVQKYLADPEGHSRQILHAYQLFKLEQPPIREACEKADAAAVDKDAPLSAHKYKYNIQTFAAYQIMLGIAAVLNRILRKLHPHDEQLTLDMNFLCDEAIWAAQVSSGYKPIGSGFAPETLVTVWSVMETSAESVKLEAAILNYWSDDETGERWMGRARVLKTYMDEMMEDKPREMQASSEGLVEEFEACST
ncbi:Fungal transcriptional regulatory N-terminal [Fusarium albosuccineum]|uniref:Fungal transcriptional regulatory N-terminal n=1 Tax=Fusarium albosuccineum TaxID=1237068 RepID=A0A8H4LGY0_9HYPO|nr:Fungal transcriptional regulatory N-terminal [Fusarium albosuccineum]